MNNRPMLLMACVFLLGTCYANEHTLLVLAAMLLVICSLLWKCIRGSRKQMLCMMIAAAAAFVIAYLHGSYEIEARWQVLGQISDGDTVSIQGEISKKQNKEDECVYELVNCYVLLSGEAVSCNHILISLEEDSYPIREILIVNGQVNTFYQAVNEGNFDQQEYYRSRKIDFQLYDADVVSVVYGRDGGYEEWLYRLKQGFCDVLCDITDEETAGILSGMLLGEKSLLDSEVKSLYQKAGISHTLAISGLHLSVFAAGIYGILRKRQFGFKAAGLCAAFFAISYTLMTGMSVSTTRAAGMFLCSVFAATVRRTYDLLNGLGAVVLCLLWQNPFLVGYSGFWFSLAAMLGIGFAVCVLSDGRREDEKNEHLEEKGGFSAFFRKMRIKKRLQDAIAGGIGIQAATIPMVACYYNEIPVYAVLLNLLIVPLLTIVLVSGAAGILAGSFCLQIGKILVLPAYGILKLYGLLCEFTLSLPLAQKITGTPTVMEMAAYYTVFGLILYGRYRYLKRIRDNDGCEAYGGRNRGTGKQLRHPVRKCRFPWTYAGIAIIAAVFCRCRVPGQEVDFLDVGQGDGIFISAGEGFCCFIDGGSSNVSSLGTYRLLPFLKAKGAKDIDYWFVSHTDSDHISGITEVLESGYKVNYLVFSYAAPQDEALTELAQTAVEAGTEVIYMNQGDVLGFGDMQMTCLYPLAGLTDEEINADDADKNARSMVLGMEMSGISFLFTGDISSDEEAEILSAYGNLNVDVYKAAHHGSNYSGSEEFLAAMSPDIAVVSCSSTNRYGHPGTEAMARLEACGDIAIYYTMNSGQVSVIWEKDGIEVSEFLK